jgi:hypothetical protein
MAPKLELCMIVKGYIAVGNDTYQINNVLGGAQRVFIPVTGGSIKGVGPAEGLEAEINPASSDGVLVRHTQQLLGTDWGCKHILRHSNDCGFDIDRVASR